MLKKIKVVKGFKIKFKGRYLDYLLNQLDDIHKQIERINKIGEPTEENYNKIIEEIEYFDELVDDSRFEKHIPTKYYGLFTEEYSDAKTLKRQAEFNYCKYELGYNRSQLMNRFCTDY